MPHTAPPAALPSTADAPPATLWVEAHTLESLAAALLTAQGVLPAHAAQVAHALVDADLEGVASHGVALLPLYLERLRAGSVVAQALPQVVQDHGGLLVLAAGHGLGQVSSHLAVDWAVQRARQHGVALVLVREAFHFGAAAYWARLLAQAGLIGAALCNTRPLMPAPGGAERVVGNNPLAVALPSAPDAPLVLDMAMSASAMGKIRQAQAAGQAIPPGWATDAQGQATTSPSAAISGMLLPAAGPKGFGLAVVIDLLCGALSEGAFGNAVQALYTQLGTPYNCAHAFLAIDASHAYAGAGLGPTVAAYAQTLRSSRKAPGTPRIYAPGDLERERRAQHGTRCPLPAPLLHELHQRAHDAGIPTRLQPV